MYFTDKKLEVKIEGDIEAARSLKRTPQMLADVGKAIHENLKFLCVNACFKM